jgi:hypothetical protein
LAENNLTHYAVGATLFLLTIYGVESDFGAVLLNAVETRFRDHLLSKWFSREVT